MAPRILSRQNRVAFSSPTRIQKQTDAGRRLTASTRSLRASAVRMNRREGERVRRLIQPWQQRALTYYDLVGEVKAAANFHGNGLSNLELFAAEKQVGKDGKIEIVPTENEQAVMQLERIQDPGGGRSNLLSAYGRLRFLIGECYLLCTNPDGEQEQWEMLSPDELRIMGDQYLRYKAPSLGAEELHAVEGDPEDPSSWEVIGRRAQPGGAAARGTALAFRLWKRHPRYSALADSSMQGVLELCEELLLLTQAVRARARSRLAGSGILYIPEEVSPAPLEPVGDEDALEDPFLRDLIEAMTAPITDEGSAGAVVPLIVRGPGEQSKNVTHLQLVDPTQLYPETGLRRECIERFAIGIDMPSEQLTGLEDSNHWTAWIIDEQTWKAHLQPAAQSLCDDLTAGFFVPTLRAAGVPNPENFVVAYDAAAVINHPNRGAVALDLNKVGAVGWEAVREANGFDPSDAMTPNEQQIWLSVYSRDPGFAITGIPTKPTPAGVPGEIAAQEAAGEGGAAQGSEVQPGVPETQPGTPGSETAEPEAGLVGAFDGNGNGARTAVIAGRIMAAADLAVLRTREVAGNRVLNALRRSEPDLERELRRTNIGARHICAHLGREKVESLAIVPSELVRGGRDLILDSLHVWGLDRDVANRLVELIEQHAARTLYDAHPAPLPARFNSYVVGLLTAKV